MDIINDLFIIYKDAPPIAKNQPPVAGAIGWSRSLFKRIKKTVLRFQTMKELIDSAEGQSVSMYIHMYVHMYILRGPNDLTHMYLHTYVL